LDEKGTLDEIDTTIKGLPADVASDPDISKKITDINGALTKFKALKDTELNRKTDAIDDLNKQLSALRQDIQKKKEALKAGDAKIKEFTKAQSDVEKVQDATEKIRSFWGITTIECAISIR
jgi:chromosome segregation ATPase